MRERSKGSAAERQVARAFFARAAEAPPDKQGRVAIPPTLREFAGLGREVVITGQFDHVEIWDAARWERQRSAGDEALAAGRER